MTASDAKLRFLIVDDHPLFREALQSAVELVYPDAEIVDASSLEEAYRALAENPAFDLALLDLNIPGTRGFDGIIQLRSRIPQLPIVVVSGHDERRIVQQAISLGASGFIPKSVKKRDLADAIASVIDGEIFVPEKYDVSTQTEEDRERLAMIERLSKLTPQQLRVLNMIRDGLLNKQIAYELDIGETTVKAHVSEILRKLNVVSRTQAVIEVSRLEAEDFAQIEGLHESGGSDQAG